MVAKKRNVILINIVIVVASIMASLYYYYCLSNISIPFHSDDAGSTFALMDDKFLGEVVIFITVIAYLLF